MSTPATFTYKSVDGLDVPLDLYLPEKVSGAPVLLWFHGGGLLQGRRDRVAPHMLRGVNDYGYALVSADYRLAPQAGIAEIYEDVKDCINWIRNELPTHVNKGAVDVTKLAVSGSSAGGYLALLSGLYVEPKPNVILPIYPITDPLGSFFTTKQPNIDWTAPAGSTTPKSAIAPFLDPKGPAVANTDDSQLGKDGENRNKFYFYMMQEANLASLLHLDQANPLKPDNSRWRISRNIREKGLPPTYIVHGDIDRAVGVEQADEVVGAAIGLNTPEIMYERLKDVDHLFDTDEKVQLEKMYRFMLKHL